MHIEVLDHNNQSHRELLLSICVLTIQTALSYAFPITLKTAACLLKHFLLHKLSLRSRTCDFSSLYNSTSESWD